MTKIEDSTDSPVSQILMDEDMDTQKEISEFVIRALLREELENATLVPVLSEKTQLVPEFINVGFGLKSNPILIGENIERPFVPQKIRVVDQPYNELFENLTKIRPVIIIAPSDIEPTVVEDIINELDTKGTVDVIVGDQIVLSEVPIDLAKGFHL